MEVVSSVGRASRLHRLNPSFISPAKSYLIQIQPIIVTLTSHFVTKKERKISEEDEKVLDDYEGYPNLYSKEYFNTNGEKVLFYIIKNDFKYKTPLRRYLNSINQGYIDCNLDREYLKKNYLYTCFCFYRSKDNFK